MLMEGTLVPLLRRVYQGGSMVVEEVIVEVAEAVDWTLLRVKEKLNWVTAIMPRP